MDNEIDFVVKMKKAEKVSEKEIFSKIKEFLEKEDKEYPNFALTSMVIDSFTSGASIGKVKKELSLPPLSEEFELFA